MERVCDEQTEEGISWKATKQHCMEQNVKFI